MRTRFFEGMQISSAPIGSGSVHFYPSRLFTLIGVKPAITDIKYRLLLVSHRQVGFENQTPRGYEDDP